MVSTTTLNGVLKVIKDLILDEKSISELAEINLIETKHALNVLISHGYVLKSDSKGLKEGKEYHYKYYVASESAKEILNNDGFTKQLSMKNNNKTIVKNKLYIKDSSFSGQINQGSVLEKNEVIISKQINEHKEKEKRTINKFIDKWFWLFLIPILIGIILILIQFKYFK